MSFASLKLHSASQRKIKHKDVFHWVVIRCCSAYTSLDQFHLVNLDREWIDEVIWDSIRVASRVNTHGDKFTLKEEEEEIVFLCPTSETSMHRTSYQMSLLRHSLKKIWMQQQHLPQECLSRYLSCDHRWPWLQTWRWTASLPWWPQHLSAAQSAIKERNNAAVSNADVPQKQNSNNSSHAMPQILDSTSQIIEGKCTKLTVMNSPFSQASSLIASKQASSLPDMLTTQWCTSGYWVEEWLPQMITFLTWVAGTPQRIATCRKQIKKFSTHWLVNWTAKGVKKTTHLRASPVVIQTGETGEVCFRDGRSRLGCNQTVGVGRVSNHKHLKTHIISWNPNLWLHYHHLNSAV